MYMRHEKKSGKRTSRLAYRDRVNITHCFFIFKSTSVWGASVGYCRNKEEKPTCDDKIIEEHK